MTQRPDLEITKLLFFNRYCLTPGLASVSMPWDNRQRCHFIQVGLHHSLTLPSTFRGYEVRVVLRPADNSHSTTSPGLTPKRRKADVKNGQKKLGAGAPSAL